MKRSHVKEPWAREYATSINLPISVIPCFLPDCECLIWSWFDTLSSPLSVILFCSFVSAQVPLCETVKVSTDPPPLSSSQPSSEIDWWADADRVGPGAADAFQMTRVVINRSSQARRVSWPIGRMTVVSFLPVRGPGIVQLSPGDGPQYCLRAYLLQKQRSV